MNQKDVADKELITCSICENEYCLPKKITEHRFEFAIDIYLIKNNNKKYICKKCLEIAKEIQWKHEKDVGKFIVSDSVVVKFRKIKVSLYSKQNYSTYYQFREAIYKYYKEAKLIDPDSQILTGVTFEQQVKKFFHHEGKKMIFGLSEDNRIIDLISLKKVNRDVTNPSEAKKHRNPLKGINTNKNRKPKLPGSPQPPKSGFPDGSTIIKGMGTKEVQGGAYGQGKKS